MSSVPIADLGMPSGAVVPALAWRQPAEDAADPTMARGAGLGGDGAPAPTATPAEGWTADPDSNVIELAAAHRTPAAFPTAPRVNPRGVAVAVRLADACLILAAGAAAYQLQHSFLEPLDSTTAVTAVAVIAMLIRSPAGEARILHDALRRPLGRRLADVALRTLLPFAVSAIVVALVGTGDPVRARLLDWLGLWAIGATAGVCGVRLCLDAAIRRWRGLGRLKQAVAIFGTGDLAERLLARLRAASPDAIELVGVFDDRARRRIASPALRSLAVGTSDDLVALSRHRDIDRVLVALPHSAEDRVVEVLTKLRRMPVEISLAPDLVGYNLPCREPDELSGLPLLDVYGRPLSFGQILLKSAIDRTLAAAALLVGAPLLLVVAIVVKLDSRGPVLFRQNRHGFGDRVIGVYKFRTMADAAADHDGVRQTGLNDPRVTRVGRFLRRWSIDELPQLINVLRGEMSLVGPRPHAISMQVEDRLNHDIVPDYAMRHHVKPGITGWAQVNGYHGPVPTEEALRARVRYDLDYINNWSFWFDLQIMLRTVRIVLGQRHAY